jgi:hypothetical protein
MDDLESSTIQKFTNAYYISQFHLPATISSTCPGSEWVYQMTVDGCVIAQPSNMLHSPGSKAVIYFAFQLFAESKSYYQASTDTCQMFKEALKVGESGRYPKASVVVVVTDGDVKCRREAKK